VKFASAEASSGKSHWRRANNLKTLNPDPEQIK